VGLFSRDPDSASGDGSAGDDGSSVFQQRGFVASVIVVGAVVVCLLVWFFARGGDTPASQPSTPTNTAVPTEQPTDDPSGPPATPPAEPTGTATTTPTARPKPGVGGCKTLNPDQRIPRTTPTAVTWEFEADMLIPTQQEGGPAVMDSAGVRSCFAHSPTGAVLAALVTLGQIRNPDLTIPVLHQRFVSNEGLRLALAEGKATPPTQGPTKTVAQFTAFKVLDYLPTRAIIAIAVRIDDQNVASIPVTMTWAKGDWKGVLQTDGSFNGATEPDLLQSMTGYVRFGGA
jgi:type IV secretory pathway VirB10-like protein